MRVDLLGHALHFSVNFRGKRIRVAHNVAVYIATCGERSHGDLITGADHFLEVSLQDAVQLDGLASSDFKRIECAEISEFIHYLPLLGGANATRQTDPSQERVGFIQLMLATLGAHVAIVLLVEPVEFR